MTDFTTEQLERLVRAVWPNSIGPMFNEIQRNSERAAIQNLICDWSFIGPVLVWLHKEVRDYDAMAAASLGNTSNKIADYWIHKMRVIMVAEDPKAAILRAAIEWNERKQGVGNA